MNKPNVFPVRVLALCGTLRNQAVWLADINHLSRTAVENQRRRENKRQRERLTLTSEATWFRREQQESRREQKRGFVFLAGAVTLRTPGALQPPGSRVFTVICLNWRKICSFQELLKIFFKTQVLVVQRPCRTFLLRALCNFVALPVTLLRWFTDLPALLGGVAWSMTRTLMLIQSV